MFKNLINIWVDPYVRKESDEESFWFNFSTLAQLKEFMVLVEDQQIQSFQYIICGIPYGITLNYYEADGTMKFHSFEATTDPFIIRLNVCSSMKDVIEWIETEQKAKPHETYLHDFTYSVENCYFYKNQGKLNLRVLKDNLNCSGAIIQNNFNLRYPECLSCRFFSENCRKQIVKPDES